SGPEVSNTPAPGKKRCRRQAVDRRDVAGPPATEPAAAGSLAAESPTAEVRPRHPRRRGHYDEIIRCMVIRRVRCDGVHYPAQQAPVPPPLVDEPPPRATATPQGTALPAPTVASPPRSAVAGSSSAEKCPVRWPPPTVSTATGHPLGHYSAPRG